MKPNSILITRACPMKNVLMVSVNRKYHTLNTQNQQSFRKLWLGEYGCDSDLQCKARCPNSYCEKKSDKNVPQCQCTNGLLLYGRCFDTCPKGFHESGGYCRHDDEDAFWQNSETQVNLQSLLNKGSC